MAARSDVDKYKPGTESRSRLIASSSIARSRVYDTAAMMTIKTNSAPKLKTMRLPSEKRPPRSMPDRVALLMRGVAETMFET